MSIPARDARRLLAAETRVANARRTLELAEEDRRKVRARVRSLLEPGVQVTAGGVQILIIPTRSGKTFRLAEFLKRHRISKTMQPYVGEGTDYDRWTVRQVAQQVTT